MERVLEQSGLKTGQREGKSLTRLPRLPRLPRWTTLAVAALAIVGWVGLAGAQQPPAGAMAGTATGAAGGNARAVRLSSVDGQVQVVEDGQVIADPAYENLPLFEGTQVVTRNDGRAEIELEDGSVVRLTPNSTVTLSVLSGSGATAHTEIVLNAGQAYFELQPSTQDRPVQVDYGTTAVTPTSFSVMRVNYDAQPGVMAVFSGQVHVTRGTALDLDVRGDQTLSLDAQDASVYNLADNIQADSWDQWNSDRDAALISEQSDKTPATDQNAGQSGGQSAGQMPGMSDLDANGSWYDVPGQGYVWSPYDAQGAGADWDPYGYGYWTSFPQYGYAWVSGYNWGYAPFNYGRWNYYGGFGWGWNPGGGNSPWWGRGGGWQSNVGTGPNGYLPPQRPRHGAGGVGTAGTGTSGVGSGGTARPVGGPMTPHVGGSGAALAVNQRPLHPPILVDHRPQSGVNAYLGFQPGQPMVVGGRIVSPLHTIAPRSTYVRSYAYLSGHNAQSLSQSMNGSRQAYSSSGSRSTYSRSSPSGGPSRPSGHGSFYSGGHSSGMHMSGGGSHGGGGHH